MRGLFGICVLVGVQYRVYHKGVVVVMVVVVLGFVGLRLGLSFCVGGMVTGLLLVLSYPIWFCV